MDYCTCRHGVIVALLLTLKLGLWHCQEVEAPFLPLNLEIHNNSLHQRLLVKWNVGKKTDESDIDLMFHIQVARSESMNIIADEYLGPDISSSRATFTWTWDSQLPLECDSHSVRIRSAVVGKVPTAEVNWSAWSPWKTHLGQNRGRTDAGIFPHERVVLEGSDVTFCCLPGRDQTVLEMTYGRHRMERSLHLGTDSYVISVQNATMTRSDGSNVRCAVDKTAGAPLGTVLLVSRLPDEPKHFSCETQDMETLRCSWSPGGKYNFYGVLGVSYVLQERFSQKSSSCHRDHCNWPIENNQQIYNFTLTAKNLLGERNINSIVYLNQRVLPLAPSNLRASHVNASFITLSWSLKADYTSLQIHCQVFLQNNPVNMTTRGKPPNDMYRVSLSGLEPYTLYDLRVRCMAASSLAGWSDWSHLIVRTQEDAPTGALDVWRQIEDGDHERIVTLYWRPSPLFRANGNISHYVVKSRPLDLTPVEREISVQGVNSSRISIGKQASSISVTAYNTAGGSSPAEVRIPASAARGTEQMIAGRAQAKDGGIYITWQPERVHGYVVEWCAAPRAPHCDLQWKKYNSTIQSDIIRSGAFITGVRYSFRVYGSMNDGEHLLEMTEGYTAELVSSVKTKVKISNIEARTIFLDWSPYPTDESQEGFITGYNVYVNDTERGCNLEKSEERIQRGGFYLCRFHIGDPNKMQMRINELRPNGKYEVAVVAITAGGETPAEFTKAYTPSDTTAALQSIIVPIILVSVLALMLLFVGCWKRTWLKNICLPEIPNPNKSKIFSFTEPKGTLNRSILTTTRPEPQTVDVVSIQDAQQNKTPKEENEPPEYQLCEIYTKIQSSTESECDKDTVSECYHPCNDETSLNDPSYKSLPLQYLEFFNQTYTGTSDDGNDEAQGYRPQMNIAQVHCPPYVMQTVDKESGLDEDTGIRFSSPDYGSEPKSPTSVGSTAFILVD